jgi:hypothetical protein
MCKVMVEEEYDDEGSQVLGEPLPPDEPAHVLALQEIEEKEMEKRDIPEKRPKQKEKGKDPMPETAEMGDKTPDLEERVEVDEKGQYIRTFVQEFTQDRYDAKMRDKLKKKHVPAPEIERATRVFRRVANQHIREVADMKGLTEKDIPDLRQNWIKNCESIMKGAPAKLPPLTSGDRGVAGLPRFT